jgi:catecholate siderophore receptor
MRAWGAQNITTARIEAPLAGLRNQLIAGFDVSYQRNRKVFWVYTLPPTVPGGYLPPAPIARTKIPVFLLNPGHTPPPGYAPVRAVAANLVCTPPATVCTSANANTLDRSDGEAADFGGFVTDRLWLTPKLSVIGSLRLDRYEADFTSVVPSGAATRLDADANLFSPKASLVYEPSDTQTWYLSWGRSETPQGASVVGAGTALALTTKDLAPEVSTSLEAGAKIGLRGGRLSLTASAFDVRKNNATQTDPATGFLQAQSGERQEVRGLELGLTGRVTARWNVSANYAYLDAKIRESFVNCVVPTSTSGAPTTVVCPMGVTAPIPVRNPAAIGQQVAFVPKHSASVFTSYDLDDLVPGLSAGGDVTYQSRLNVGYTAVSASYADRGNLVASRLPQVPQNVTVDAFVAYRFGAYRVALNVYNLADRLNYTQVFGNRAIPAARRTFILSLGATF